MHLRRGNLLQPLMRKTNNSWQKFISNTSVYTSHTHTAHTQSSHSKTSECFISYEHHSKGHIIAFLSGHCGLAFISELMMFPCSTHWGLFNDTWGREGGWGHEGGTLTCLLLRIIEPKWLPSAQIFPRWLFIHHRTCVSQENHNTDGEKTFNSPLMATEICLQEEWHQKHPFISAGRAHSAFVLF